MAVEITVEPIDETVTVTTSPIDETVTVAVTPIDETVTVTVNTGDISEYNVSVNGDLYEVISDDVDIPILNSEFTPVGTIDNGNVLIGDAPVTFTIDDVPVASLDIPAEKAVAVDIGEYIPPPSKLTIQLTYETLAVTIWEAAPDAQGNGALGTIDAIPSVTSPAATINYSASTPVAGISVNASTGQVSVSNYASIPTAANSLVIAWEVDPSDPNYTGSGSVEIVVTKKSKTPITSVAGLRLDASFDFQDESKLVRVGVTDEISAVIALNGTTQWQQETAGRRAFTFIKDSVIRLLNVFGVNAHYGVSSLPNGNIATNSTIWICGNHISRSTANYMGATASSYLLQWTGGNQMLMRPGGGTTVTFAITNEIMEAITKADFYVIEACNKSENQFISFYTKDGLIGTVTANVANTGAVSAATLAVLAVANGTGTSPINGKIAKILITTGDTSATDREIIVENMLYEVAEIDEPYLT
jgi:hypothetical protein